MTSLFRSRQHADELHDALTGRAAPDVAERHAELLRTVSLLTTHTPVAPRPDFSADLRERLMAAAETELVAAPAPERRTTPVVAPSPARRRLATVAASLVVVGGTAGMAAAAQGALPGDPLYPIKRGGEAVVAAVEPGSSGTSDLDRADTRLAEARALQDRGADTALVTRSLEEFRGFGERGADRLFADYAASGDPAAVDAVRDFTAAAMPGLDDLARDDAALEGTIVQLSDVLAAIDAEARRLCPTCGTDGPVSLPASLGEGAAAASLTTLLVAPAEQAQTDRDALAGLDPAQVRRLGRAAETEADETPQSEPEGSDDDDVLPVVAGSPRGPVGSTLVATGEVVDETLRGATDAVDGLVGGVTGTVRSVVPRDSALGGTVGGLTDTLDQAIDGVSGLPRLGR